MSDRVPHPADPEALRRVVQPLRLAAVALADPWASLRAAIARAEELPGLLSPELELASFSPFEALDGVGGEGGVESRERAARARRVPHGRPGAPSAAREPAPRAPLLSSAHVPAGARQAPAAAPRQVRPAEGSVAATAADGRSTAAEAVRDEVGQDDVAPPDGAVLAEGAATRPGAEGVPGNTVLQGSPFALVDRLVGEIERLDPPGRLDDPDAARGRAPAAHAAAVARRWVPGAADGGPGSLHREMDASAPLAPGTAAPSAATAPSAAGAAPASSTPLELLRRSLLAAPFEQQQPSAPAAPAAPPRPDLAAMPRQATAAEPAALESGELAWLVNEALIEQARRHGMDLS